MEPCVAIAICLCAVGIVGCSDQPSDNGRNETGSDSVSCYQSAENPRLFKTKDISDTIGAELVEAPPNAALRDYLRSPEFRQLGLSDEGWSQVTNDVDEALFALPGNDVPLDWIVSATRTSGSDWEVAGGSPCWPVKVQRGRQAVLLFEPVGGFRTGEGGESVIKLTAYVSGCVKDPVELDVSETSRSVIVDASYDATNGDGEGPCIPEDQPRQQELQLKRPLGNRKVMQGNYVPPRELHRVGSERFPELSEAK